MNAPNAIEYPDFFEKYIALVPKGNTYEKILQDNTMLVIKTFGDIVPEKHLFKYADNKWTIKQMLQHINDVERVMAYRAMIAIRGHKGIILPDMDENLYADNASAYSRSMESLLEEFNAIRLTTLHLFKNCTEEQTQWLANRGHHFVSARAYGYMIIGHTIHHINVLHQKYNIS